MMISTHKSILVHIFTPKVEKKWRILRRDFLREELRYVLVHWSLVFFTPNPFWFSGFEIQTQNFTLVNVVRWQSLELLQVGDYFTSLASRCSRNHGCLSKRRDFQFTWLKEQKLKVTLRSVFQRELGGIKWFGTFKRDITVSPTRVKVPFQPRVKYIARLVKP